MLNINTLQVRLVRGHLVVIGYLAICICTMVWGLRDWENCVMADKILCVSGLIFVIQGLLMKKKDLPFKLRMSIILAWLVFMYIHFIIF